MSMNKEYKMLREEIMSNSKQVSCANWIVNSFLTLSP